MAESPGMKSAACIFPAGLLLAGTLTGGAGVLAGLAIAAVVMIATSTFYLVRGACLHNDQTNP